jgi:sodium transport system ATP-binding protein
MIRLSRLTKRYGELVALRELTLEVKAGEVYALLGPNGAGKTTALRCLATLLAPSDGTAFVDGIDVAHDPVRTRARFAFLAASMGLYERLSARELIAYFGRLHGLEGARLGSRIQAVVELFGIEAFENRMCGRLSTGQRQRVSLARALVHDPPVLILDEPTIGLDVLSGQTIYDFISRERDRGKAVLFSTHQMDEVDLLADRVGVLKNGSLVAEGAPADLLEQAQQPSLARAFLALVAPDEGMTKDASAVRGGRNAAGAPEDER